MARKEAVPTNEEFFSFPMSTTPKLVWHPLEELGTSMPWQSADLLAVQRMSVVRDFAAAVLDLDQVESVWLRQAIDGLEVSVVVSDADLEFDLSLRERFIELASERLCSGEGDLFVYQRDDAPGWVFEGTQITA
jgi:hypothetical protein